LIKSVSEPAGGEGSLRRHYLVLYDGVPGGTGYLSELWKEDHLLDVLQLALDTLLGCPCNRDENRDGCYRCLFAYQAQRDLPLLSRTLAAKELSDILKERHSL